MAYDLSTIEHDFIHMKDYFSNYKFTYKERRSKLDFLQNITNEPCHDTTVLIASSKEQLVEVKNIYKNTDLEIRELSKSIFIEEESLKENKRILEDLSNEEENLKNELARLTRLNETILIYDKLNGELDEVENEINKVFVDIENTSNAIDPTSVESKKNEEKNLRDERNDLAAKQRRLTIINTENYIEDIYFWKRSYLDILEKVFGAITVTATGDKFNLKVVKNESVLEVVVKGKMLSEAYLSKNQCVETLEEFEKIKEYAFMINDAKPMLSFFSAHC